MEYISLSYTSLGIAVLFIVSAMAVSFRYRLGLERDLAVGAVRAFVQLTAIGYVLHTLVCFGEVVLCSDNACYHACCGGQECCRPGSRCNPRACLLRWVYPFLWGQLLRLLL